MSLPVKLGIGQLSIYGGGSTQNLFQSPPETNPAVRFGIVNAAFNYYGNVSVGQSVMYKIEDSIPVFYGAENTQYFIVSETKIILIENPVIIPPAP